MSSVASKDSTATASTQPAVAQPVAIEIANALDAQRRWYPAPGALALVRVGGAAWWGSSGSADLAGTPIGRTTRFRVASITKPIVAALVLDAAGRGELSLDDAVGDHLPGVLPTTPVVTIRMLLNHTSGIYDEGNDGDPLADIERLTDPAMRANAGALVDRYLAGERDVMPDRMMVALAETHERYFEPGEGYHYSNINYELAVMVLVAATGETIDSLLQTRIIEPLDLRFTSIAPVDLRSPELRGYGVDPDTGALVDLTDDLLSFGNGGHGGIISTADELLSIMQAIVSARILPAALVVDMKAPTASSNLAYGLGLATYELSCGKFFGHEGGVNGTASIAIVSDDGGDGVVVALDLRNDDDPRLPALADLLLCSRSDRS